MTEPIPLTELEAALERISSEAVVTPVVRSDALDRAVGAEVLCKAENEQRAGAFKFRGAFNRLSAIPEEDRHRGVVAVSSGNHGAAVALAGKLLDIAVTVHIPEDAPVAKRRLIEEARHALRRLEGRAQAQAAYQVAVLRFGLDDLDGTFVWLNRAVDHPGVGIHWISQFPFWKPLRNDPRFIAVLRRMNLS